MIAHKKIIIRLLLITLGFFGMPALFRATGAADHFAQVEQPGACYFDLILSPSSYDRCLREHLGGKPYWDLRSRDEYQGHWVAHTSVFKNGLRWQVDIAPRGGFGMELETPDEIFALRVELSYPSWWSSEYIGRFRFKGGSTEWLNLSSVDSSSTVFEAYAPFTRALAARIANGETIEIEAKQAEGVLVSSLPPMPKQTNLGLMELQKVADKVSQVIDAGEAPRSVYDGYSLQRKGDSFTLLASVGEQPPLAHWQLKTAQRTIKYKSGDKYKGAMRAGKYHGQGTLNYAGGDRYSGNFVNGKLEGQGHYTWASGGSYTGDWIKGQRTGQGTYTWPDGRRYEGGFVKGQRSGEGSYISKDGTRYEGGFKDNNRHGQGVLIFPSGNQYEGDFVNGNRTGEGVFTWTSGDEHRGEFLEGKRHGSGLYTSRKGWRYEGEWKNGERHGYGEYTSSSGRRTTREYYRGERVREPEPEVASRSSGRKGCGSYENPCVIPSDTGIDAFAKNLARAADQAFGSNSYGGSSNASRAAEIQAENEARWRANDRKLKRKIYDAKVASDRRNKERAAERTEYNRHNGTCDKDLENDSLKKAWHYIWSSTGCGGIDCDLGGRVFVSNLVYARDHSNLEGAFYDEVNIQYKNKKPNPLGHKSNGYVCRGDARNARRKFIAERSDNSTTYFFDVNLPEYP